MINQIYFGNKLLKFNNYDKLYSYVEKHYKVYNCQISNYEGYLDKINSSIYENQLISSDIDKVISIVNRIYNINLIKNQNNTLKFYLIKSKNKLIDLNTFKKIIDMLKNLGWNLSHSIIDTGIDLPVTQKNIQDIEEKYNSGVIDIVIFISALNDIEIYNIPDVLYHLSPSCFSSKIKSKGLVPKSNNKLNNHDERVYLFLNYDYNKIFDFAKKTLEYFEDDFILKRYPDLNVTFNIYKIDLNRTDKRNIRIFYDPYFANNIAVYSRNGIPPVCIDKLSNIKLIYNLKDNK